jgi:predicted nuclease of predicted toxin-antitoxin system
MAQLSFLADEHVKRSYVHALRGNGFKIVAVAEGDETGQRDDIHLERSSRGNLVVLTNDDDFVRLAGEHSHAGIVFYSEQNHDPSDFVTAIRRIDRFFSPDDMRNHVEWLENWL